MNIRNSVVAVMFLILGISGVYADKTGHGHEHGDLKSTEVHTFCPVCGPGEDTEELSIAYMFEGKKYAFCSMGCMKTFKKDPQAYLKENVVYKKHE